MHDQLESLIGRLELVLRADDRPLSLHWSDVETLRLLANERRDREARVSALKVRLGAMLDDALRETGPSRTTAPTRSVI